MLGSDTGSGTVGTTEDDGTGDVTARHVVCLAARVDDLVDRLHGKVPCHCCEGLAGESDRGGRRREEKENLLNSQMGRRPARAAPTAIPVKPASVMGVCTLSRQKPCIFQARSTSPLTSITRSSPNLSSSPLVTYKKKKKVVRQSTARVEIPHKDETCLVSTIVPGNLFTDDKDGLVTDHLLLHRLVERVSHSLRVCVSSASISKTGHAPSW